jgi:hypothetical protein
MAAQLNKYINSEIEECMPEREIQALKDIVQTFNSCCDVVKEEYKSTQMTAVGSAQD